MHAALLLSKSCDYNFFLNHQPTFSIVHVAERALKAWETQDSYTRQSEGRGILVVDNVGDWKKSAVQKLSSPQRHC